MEDGNGDGVIAILHLPSSILVFRHQARSAFPAIATRFAFFAADLAAAPWLGHGRISFRVVSRCCYRSSVGVLFISSNRGA